MDKKTVLSFTFASLSLLASLFFWFFWKNHLELSLSFLPYLPGAIAFIFLLSTLNFLCLFAPRKTFLLFSVLMSALPILLGMNLVPFSYLSGALLMVGLLLSHSSFQKTKEIYKKFTIRNILQTRTNFYALTLSLTLLVIGNSTTRNGSFRITIPEETIPFMAKFSASLLSPTGGTENSVTLDLAGQAQVRQGISPLNFGNELIEEQLRIAKGLVEKELNKFLSDYVVYLPYLAGLTFFLSISFFAPLVVVGSDLLFLTFFKLLQFLKLVSVRTRNEEIEYLEI